MNSQNAAPMFVVKDAPLHVAWTGTDPDEAARQWLAAGGLRPIEVRASGGRTIALVEEIRPVYQAIARITGKPNGW